MYFGRNVVNVEVANVQVTCVGTWVCFDAADNKKESYIWTFPESVPLTNSDVMFKGYESW